MPLLDRRELGVAVELGRHTGRRDGVPHRVLDRDDGIAVLVVDHAVELRLGVGDPPVLRERVLAERVADALDPGPVLRRLELASSSGARSPSRPPPCAPACRADAPSGAAKTRLRTPPCSDANSDSIRSVAFCVSDPGISNWSLQAAADRRDEHDQQGDDADPRRGRRATGAWRTRASSARARRSRAARAPTGALRRPRSRLLRRARSCSAPPPRHWSLGYRPGRAKEIIARRACHAISISTLPTAPASTAACASAVRSSGKRCSGSPASAPTGSAPASAAAETSSTASSFVDGGTV